METNYIYKGDCMEYMSTLADCSVDLVASDVPYRLQSRGGYGTSGGMYKKRLVNSGKVFNNNDIDIEDYLYELYRILKDGTHCYLMTNNFNIIHFLKVIDDSPFHFVKNLIWMKDNKVMGTCYMSQYEYIIMLRKGNRAVNDCGVSDVLQYANKKDKKLDGGNIHDSQKPVDLFRMLIRQSSNEGDVVFDPFMGSGTTALACIKEGRRYIGCEIDEEYHNVCMRRIKEETSKLTLF